MGISSRAPNALEKIYASFHDVRLDYAFLLSASQTSGHDKANYALKSPLS